MNMQKPVILPVDGKQPQFGKDCFLAPNCTVVRDVVLGDQCTVWFSAVVRGDVNSIRVGSRTKIQDGAVILCTYQKAATSIGSDVSIGHNAIVHGSTIHDNVLVGMGAIVMDHAVVEAHCIIAAGAIVLENMRCESGWIYAGIPAKKVKQVSAAQIEGMRQTAQNYLMYADWFRPVSSD